MKKLKLDLEKSNQEENTLPRCLIAFHQSLSSTSKDLGMLWLCEKPMFP
jgi:hypothetical protein